MMMRATKPLMLYTQTGIMSMFCGMVIPMKAGTIRWCGAAHLVCIRMDALSPMKSILQSVRSYIQSGSPNLKKNDWIRNISCLWARSRRINGVYLNLGICCSSID